MWREDREQFNLLAKQIVRKSLGLWLSCVQTHSHTPGQWGLMFTRVKLPREEKNVCAECCSVLPPTSTSVSTLFPSRLSFSLPSPPLSCDWVDALDEWLLMKKAKRYTLWQCSKREPSIIHWISTQNSYSQPFWAAGLSVMPVTCP